MTLPKFATRLALFAAGLLVLFAACSVHYAVLSRSDNLVRQLQLFAALEPEVLILGDSHAAMNVDMETLGPRYASLAYPGENWREIFLKTQYALAAKPSVRLVVIPLDMHMFSSYRGQDLDMTHSMRFTRAYDSLEPVYESRWFTLRYVKSLVAYYVPLCLGPNWSNYRVLVLDGIQGAVSGKGPVKRIDIDDHGSLFYSDTRSFMDLPEPSRREAARERAVEQLRPPATCEPLVHAFDEFLRYCADHHVAVVGVRYPLTLEFQAAAKAYDLTGVETIYMARSTRFAAMLDYSLSMATSPRLFRDEDHLTREGARAFTRKLKDDLELIRQRGDGSAESHPPVEGDLIGVPR